MKKTIASGLIGLMALGGVAVAAPSAFAQEDEGQTRQERIEERLNDAVESGRLTQDEANERLAQIQARQEARAERRAEKVETLTSVLGVSADELQAAREAGDSIADVAAAEGVDVQSVVDALVADANARLDAKIADGSIDAERGAEISDSLEERITARVNGEAGERGDGERHRGRRGFGNRGGADAPTADA